MAKMDRPDEDGPVIGGWYETEEGEVFQVYALDEDTDAIEVRFLDGTVDTWVLSDWPGFEEIEPPEAWGTMDNYAAGRRNKGD